LVRENGVARYDPVRSFGRRIVRHAGFPGKRTRRRSGDEQPVAADNDNGTATQANQSAKTTSPRTN
jgi:hypothetical protein